MYQRLWFSAPPTSPDCMVVGFIHGTVEIHYVSGEPIWHSYEVRPLYEFSPVCFPTYHDGDLYHLYEMELRVFKHLGENNISSEVLIAEAPRSCCRSSAQYFLVKCDQHLLLLVMGGFGEPMEVFKLNDSRREWDKVNGVGKHMIYICDATCICIEAKLPEMENKIYLAQSSSRNKKMVFYSLETSTYHTFDGKNIQENLADVFVTAHLSAHAWIEPSWLKSP
uniref:uncharacterized protein LOC122583689 n=1 Tax=Erigeron canadensis TaxID=72917 RepID=UPI001CB93E5E|nr:uncharacterized protein LOC122583689 [Erigeron canadensis]